MTSLMELTKAGQSRIAVGSSLEEGTMERRKFLKLSALAGAGLTLSPVFRSGATALGGGTVSAPASGVIQWGAHAQPRGTQDARIALTDLEAMIGRKLAISRHYTMWDSVMPDNFQKWSSGVGRTPYVAWHAVKRSSTAVAWSSIASGAQDQTIRSVARALAGAGYPMYFCFHHEPENDTRCGNSADFVAAYDHVHTVFEAEGVANVTWVVTLMATSYAGGHGGYAAWLPSTYDLLGVDGYNRANYYSTRGRGWRSFASIFTPAHNAAVTTGKGLFIGENGCVEHGTDPDAKATWFVGAETTMKAWPELKATLYSHVWSDRDGLAYSVDTSTASLASFRAVGLDLYFA